MRGALMSTHLRRLLLSRPGGSGTANHSRGWCTAAKLLSAYDVRHTEAAPLDQRRLTFDTHALVRELESHGFDKAQAEVIVSTLTFLTNSSLDTVYRDMVTQAQQELIVQQIMAHLDSIRKDMVILEKSEFATLRAENEKMKIELEHVKQHLLNETNQIRADTKLDINLERSRLTDLFTDQEKKLMEASTEFHKKSATTDGTITEIHKKIDIDIASLKTLMESHKLDTIRYLAGKLFATKEYIEGLLLENCGHINKPGTNRKPEVGLLILSYLRVHGKVYYQQWIRQAVAPLFFLLSLVASVFTCLAIALGFYRLWK